MSFWDAASQLPTLTLLFLLVALLVAFGFEFINGFHDTANAVTTVIYTRTLTPTPAVIYSGAMNFLGALITVLVGSAAVAFTIVNLLPVDLLVGDDPTPALVMVLSLLLAGVVWNLGTWYLGLPVSSSHTLIGAILGVGLANGLLTGGGLGGVRWDKAGEVGLGLLLSPLVGFGLAYGLLLVLKRTVREPRLYVPPVEGERPPRWVRGVLLATCGGVSFAHGSNDGQKGMGLLLLVLIGFMPAHYALNVTAPGKAGEVHDTAVAVRDRLPADADPEVRADLDRVVAGLAGRNFAAVPPAERWELRRALVRLTRPAGGATAGPLTADERKAIAPAVEFVPLWVVVGTALALGVGTTVGYKRIVVTVAEKIGKTHLTYAQGAAAEAVAAATILGADVYHLPVSTTQVLSSGVAGTMAANGSGVQGATARKILLAWVLTLPASMLLAGVLYTVGRQLAG